MYKEVLRSIDGISLFPVIAIVLFMVIFLFILIYVIRMDKQRIRQMAEIPLEDRPVPTTNHSQKL